MDGNSKQIIHISGTTNIKSKKVQIGVGVEGASPIERQSSNPQPFVFQVEYPVADFCGRESILCEIFSAFQRNELVVISGLGGVGKTELARKFIERQKDYKSIVWLDSTLSDTLKTSLRGLAAKLDKEELLPQELYEQILLEKSLFVFDNAEEDVVMEFLPLAKVMGTAKPDILITSRCRYWNKAKMMEKYLICHEICLAGLSRKASLTLMKNILFPFNLEDSEADTRVLGRKLNHHPRLVHKVTTAILDRNSWPRTESNNFRIANFLRNFESNFKPIAPAVYADIIGKVISKIPIYSNKFAEELLQILSLLPNASIPKHVLVNSPADREAFEAVSPYLKKYFLISERDGVVIANPLVTLLEKSQFTLQKEQNSKIVRKCIHLLERQDNQLELMELLMAVWSKAAQEDNAGALFLKCKKSQEAILQAPKTESNKIVLETLANAAWKTSRSDRENSVLEIFKYLVEEKKIEVSKENDEGMNNFLDSASCGQLEVVKYLVEEKNFDPVAYNRRGMNAFLLAAARGQLHILRFFIDERNVDLNVTDISGKNVVSKAAIEGHLEVVRYLVEEKQMDPTITDITGFHSLHEAVRFNQLKIVQYLVGRVNLDPMAYNSNGCNSFLIAATRGLLDIIKYFIEIRKVELNVKDDEGNELVRTIIQEGHITVVKYLIDENKIDPWIDDDDGFNIFLDAVYFDRLDVVKYLVEEERMDPVPNSSSGWNAFFMSAHFGHLDILKYFIEDRRVDKNIRNEVGNNVLSKASQRGQLKVVKYLVEDKHMDPSIDSPQGFNSFHDAVWYNQLEVVKYFVEERDFNPVVSNSFGRNGFHLAAARGHIKILKYFIDERHVDVTVWSNSGNNAVSKASMEGHLEVVKYLVEEKEVDPSITDNKGFDSFLGAVRFNHLEIVKYFTEKQSCDPLTTYSNGWSALRLAAARGHLSIVKYFVEDRNFDLNVKDRGVGNIVKWANENGHVGIVNYLITCAKTNPDMGFNSFEYAVWFAQLEVVKYLVEEEKFHPGTNSSIGWNALHIAAAAGHIDIVKYFIEGRKVSLDVRDESGIDIITKASEHYQECVVQYLTEKKTSCSLPQESSSRNRFHFPSFMKLYKSLTGWKTSQSKKYKPDFTPPDSDHDSHTGSFRYLHEN